MNLSTIKTGMLTLILSILFLQQNISAQEITIKGSNTLHAYFKGKTKPLRDLTPMPGTPRTKRDAKKANKPKFTPPNFINYQRQSNENPNAFPQGIDPVRQYNVLTTEKSLVEPKLVIEGIDEETADVGVPDTNGDASPDYYVQIVNASWLQIFEKDGTPLSDAFSANTIWSQIGKQSFSDPVILYDEEAERWLLTDLANIDEILYGVSETADPMGAWYLYSLNMPGFADYPKYGVWPNAYIFTINEGNDVFPVYALNRQQLLSGAGTIDVQRVEIPGINGGFPTATPMDWNSLTPPPTDEVFVVRLSDDAWGNGNNEDLVEVWTIDIDWETPDNTITTSTQLPTAPYDSDGCSISDGSYACIPQPGTSQGIDGIMAVIMNNACYWNYGTHESAVLTFSVDAGEDVSGIRWMELRRDSPESEWVLYQEGTYAPDDGVHRFIGSIAINGKGDIGLAYSVSGENTFPSLRYTGRSASDPLGVMTVDEYEFASGGGVLSQDRFGDYAHMSVDPLDGSFWFTGEYVGEDGYFNTKIVNFGIRKDTFDIAPISLDAPQNFPDLGNNESVTITIKNVGLEAASDISVGYIFESGTPFIETAAIDTLLPDSIYIHTFIPTVDMSVVGGYKFKIFTTFDLDQNVTNDTLRKVRRNLPHIDAGITNIEGLDGFSCDSILDASFVFTNTGVDTLTKITIEYQLNGGETQNYVWLGNLPGGESASIEVTLSSFISGTNTVVVNTSSPNDLVDEIPENDGYTRDFEVLLEDGIDVTLEINFDYYPEETSWQLQDADGEVIFSGGPYPFQELGTITESWCLKEDDCYTFIIFDAYGDGLADGQYEGDYSIYDADGNIFASLINVHFGSEEHNEFCVSIPCYIDADFDVTSESATGSNDGAILISVTSGVSPFTYSIDGGETTQDNMLFSGLSAGNYKVLVTDANGCIHEEEVIVDVIIATGKIEEKYKISVFPNPSEYGVFRVQVKGLQGVSNLELQVVDALGRPVIYQTLASIDDYHEGILSLYNYPAGIYYVRFKNEEISRLIKIVRL